MSKIDAHHHLWNYHPETHSWIDDQMNVLKRDFKPSSLKTELDKIQYDGTVVVQASQSEEETIFLLEQADQFPFIRGVVGWLDLRDPAFEDKLSSYSKNAKLKGLRHVVQDEPDVHFMLREDFLRGISLLSRYNLTYDILIFPKHIKVATELVNMFPEQKFVVDHIAKPDIMQKVISPWREDIRELAKYDNVFCKLSGMVTEANWDSWKYEDFIPYLDVVYKAFGEDRLMIGSDWPVCTLAGSYSEVMSIVEQYFSGLSPATRDKILGMNAQRFYNLQ